MPKIFGTGNDFIFQRYFRMLSFFNYHGMTRANVIGDYQATRKTGLAHGAIYNETNLINIIN